MQHGPRRRLSGWATRLAAGTMLIVGVLITLGWPVSAAGQEQDKAQTASEDLLGSYSATIGIGDVPAELPGGPSLIGQWIVSFRDDGSYVLARQDIGTVIAGSFTVDEGTVTLAGETGLLPCANAIESATATEATYEWSRDETVLTMTPVEEACAGRGIILGTRDLGAYEACGTSPLSSQPATDGTPATTDETPAAETPTAEPTSPLGGILGGETLGGEEGGDDPEAGIDLLLRQSAACWATGDPARFLPLHSEDTLDIIVQGGTLAELQEFLLPYMASPLTFERVGNVRAEDDTHATARIRVAQGGEELFIDRYAFVLVDGTWLWDSFFLFEQ